MAEEKKNPFAKLGAQSAPTSVKKAAASAEQDSAEEASEEEVVEAAKERVAKKRAARSVKAKAEPETEETEEVDNDAGEETADDSDEAAEKPAAKKTTRRTAKQVEEEYAAKQEALEAQIAALKAQIDGGAPGGVEVVRDRVVLEGGAGGDLRAIGESRTLVNDDWRATNVDGLRLVVGRSSAQATNSFAIPVSLAKSLSELLAEIDEITE